MSTVSNKRKPMKEYEGYIVGNTFEEVCAQEMAALNRYVMEQAMEMSRPKAPKQVAKKPPK